jgi:RNA polymerase sigma factor (sigma-70 family)
VAAQTEEAWLQLLPGLRRFARSLTGSTYDADDLVQGTVERVLARGLPEQTELRRWTFRVCRNLWIDELRGRSVRSRHVVDSDQVDPESIGRDPGNVERRALEEAMRAMQRLPIEQREVLAMVAIEGMTYRETASVLDIPEGTVMSRLSRARAQLTSWLDTQPAEGMVQ